MAFPSSHVHPLEGRTILQIVPELEAGGAERTTVGIMTSNAFDVLGARAALGRTFMAGEDAPGGGADVVILSWGLW